jgi:hypothetical protein
MGLSLGWDYLAQVNRACASRLIRAQWNVLRWEQMSSRLLLLPLCILPFLHSVPV